MAMQMAPCPVTAGNFAEIPMSERFRASSKHTRSPRGHYQYVQGADRSERHVLAATPKQALCPGQHHTRACRSRKFSAIYICSTEPCQEFQCIKCMYSAHRKLPVLLQPAMIVYSRRAVGANTLPTSHVLDSCATKHPSPGPTRHRCNPQLSYAPGLPQTPAAVVQVV